MHTFIILILIKLWFYIVIALSPVFYIINEFSVWFGSHIVKPSCCFISQFLYASAYASTYASDPEDHALFSMHLTIIFVFAVIQMPIWLNWEMQQSRKMTGLYCLKEVYQNQHLQKFRMLPFVQTYSGYYKLKFKHYIIFMTQKDAEFYHFVKKKKKNSPVGL